MMLGCVGGAEVVWGLSSLTNQQVVHVGWLFYQSASQWTEGGSNLVALFGFEIKSVGVDRTRVLDGTGIRIAAIRINLLRRREETATHSVHSGLRCNRHRCVGDRKNVV